MNTSKTEPSASHHPETAVRHEAHGSGNGHGKPHAHGNGRGHGGHHGDSGAAVATDVERSERIRGKTLRWTWTEGPVKDSTHEHVFNPDGTVTWTCIGGPGKGHSATEKSYSAMRLTDNVHAVSYLSSTGWTLTVVLNFWDHRMVGFASNGKEWTPCRGTFDEITATGGRRGFRAAARSER